MFYFIDYTYNNNNFIHDMRIFTKSGNYVISQGKK